MRLMVIASFYLWCSWPAQSRLMWLKNKLKDEVREGMRRVGGFLIKVPQFNFGYMKLSLDNKVCITRELPG